MVYPHEELYKDWEDVFQKGGMQFWYVLITCYNYRMHIVITCIEQEKKEVKSNSCRPCCSSCSKNTHNNNHMNLDLNSHRHMIHSLQVLRLLFRGHLSAR